VWVAGEQEASRATVTGRSYFQAVPKNSTIHYDLKKRTPQLPSFLPPPFFSILSSSLLGPSSEMGKAADVKSPTTFPLYDKKVLIHSNVTRQE
jgi:hypothetical protein